MDLGISEKWCQIYFIPAGLRHQFYINVTFCSLIFLFQSNAKREFYGTASLSTPWTFHELYLGNYKKVLSTLGCKVKLSTVKSHEESDRFLLASIGTSTNAFIFVKYLNRTDGFVSKGSVPQKATQISSKDVIYYSRDLHQIFLPPRSSTTLDFAPRWNTEMKMQISKKGNRK